MIPQLLRSDVAVHAAHDGVWSFAVHRGFVERRSLVDALEVEADDGLRFAIFQDLEVARLKAADDFARLFVADHHVGEHQVAVHLEGVGRLRIRLRLALVLRRQPSLLRLRRARPGR